MDRLEEHNMREIERLSQRGKTLSIVDLIEANTLSGEMAAHLFYIVAHGASFLTAARPGNAGKTTLMQCLLTFLPTNTRIVTFSDPAILSKPPKANSGARVCYLCHEIGSGPWYGYLWGKDVGKLFSLIDEKHLLASCIHADTLDELRAILLSDKLNVAENNFRNLDLILFMHLSQSGLEYTRRVCSSYEATGASIGQASHQPLFRWNQKTDSFHKQGDSLLVKKLARHNGQTKAQLDEQLAEIEGFFEWLLSKGIKDFRKVRREILRFWS